jgi:hypothetical protein
VLSAIVPTITLELFLRVFVIGHSSNVAQLAGSNGIDLWELWFNALFPVPTLGAHLAVAAGFPTLFSTASGVFGLVAGPSSVSRRWISNEAFQLAWAGGCATGSRTRSRHIREFVPAS